MIRTYYLKTENREKVHIRNIDRLKEGPYDYTNLTPEIDGKILLNPFELSKQLFSKGMCAKCNKILFEQVVLREITSVYTETYGLTAQHLERHLYYIILDNVEHIYLNKKNEMICKECSGN